VLVAGNTAGELWAIDAKGDLSQRGVFGDVPTSDGNGHVYPANHQNKAGSCRETSCSSRTTATHRLRHGARLPESPATSSCNTTDTLIEIDIPKLAKASILPVTKAVRGRS